MENLFEAAGKTTRRVVEGVEDASSLFFNSVWEHSPAVLFGHDTPANEHSNTIRRQINRSFFHGDLDEAAYQMKREVYFCSTVEGLSGTKNELESRAGLKAIENGLPPFAVAEVMQHATDDPMSQGLFSREPDLARQKLQEFQDMYKKDPADYCHKRVNLRNQIKHATENNQPVNPQDQCKLAMYDLAFADLRAQTGDASPVIRRVLTEAKDMLKAAKKAGADTTFLEKVAKKVDWNFDPAMLRLRK